MVSPFRGFFFLLKFYFCCLRKSLWKRQWIMGHTAWRRQIFAACATKSMKVNGIEIFRLRPIKKNFDHNEYTAVFAEPIIHATSQFGSLVQYISSLPPSQCSHFDFRSFFLSLSISISDRFCYGLGKSFCFTIFWGLYKKKNNRVGIACGYCILCTTMPRINWLLLNTSFLFLEGFLSHQEHYSSSVRFNFLSYPLWTFGFSLLHTFNQLPERHLFAFIVVSTPFVQKEERKKNNIQILTVCYCVHLCFSVIVALETI